MVVMVGPEARFCGMSAVRGCKPRRMKSKALLSTIPSTTIGVRKRTPPRIVVPTKRETAVMNPSLPAHFHRPGQCEAQGCCED